MITFKRREFEKDMHKLVEQVKEMTEGFLSHYIDTEENVCEKTREEVLDEVELEIRKLGPHATSPQILEMLMRMKRYSRA